MASIIVMTGIQEGQYYVLDRGRNLVGRSETASIRIFDMRISRKHMQICYEEDKQRYYAVDIGSKSGVFINDRRIDKDEPLVDGDCITIGQSVLLFTSKDITDRQSALEQLRASKLELPTINPAANRLHGYDPDMTSTNAGHFQDFREWAGADRMTLAIVFTDMIDSTMLTQKLGNESMNQVRRAHFARARKLIDEHVGHEVKTNGDEFMVAFRTTVNALNFALDLRTNTGDGRISIRAGVHIGPVTVEDYDVQGAAVSYAARVIGMASDGGVWLSSEAKDHIDQEKAPGYEDLLWQSHPDCVLKGFPGEHLLWSVKRES